jgi:hypothetical protein
MTLSIILLSGKSKKGDKNTESASILIINWQMAHSAGRNEKCNREPLGVGVGWDSQFKLAP